jgi:histone-lysine N-methyltransferase SETD1
MTKAAKDRALTAAYAACKAIAPTFRVDRSRIHGLGVYCTVPLPAKCAALEYVGEIISDANADAREAAEKRSIVDAAAANGRVASPAELARASTYMFALDPVNGTVVDAARKGNATRFVNHCCEPNCVTRVVVVGGEKKILLFTSRDVAAGEELTYDYMFKPDLPENEAPCDCGADTCRGIINVR